MTTGWPSGMLQDDSQGLSKWLSNTPNARQDARDAAQANPEIDFPTLYSVTGDVKDINTLLVPMAQAITTRNELEVFAAVGRLLAKTVEEFIELTAERDALANAAKSVTQRFDALKPSDPARMAKLNINALRFALNDMKKTT